MRASSLTMLLASLLACCGPARPPDSLIDFERRLAAEEATSARALSPESWELVDHHREKARAALEERSGRATPAAQPPPEDGFGRTGRTTRMEPPRRWAAIKVQFCGSTVDAYHHSGSWYIR